MLKMLGLSVPLRAEVVTSTTLSIRRVRLSPVEMVATTVHASLASFHAQKSSVQA
jgi:hypothetical protein